MGDWKIIVIIRYFQIVCQNPTPLSLKSRNHCRSPFDTISLNHNNVQT